MKLTYLYLLVPQIYDKPPAELTHHEIMLLQAQDSFLIPEKKKKKKLVTRIPISFFIFKNLINIM